VSGRALAAIAAITLTVAAAAGSLVGQRAAAVDDPPFGPLHVAGNRLVSADGRGVQLRGVNRSGTEYACIQGWGIFSGPSDAASLAAMKSWGVNAVRIPLNEDCWLGINGAAESYSGPAYRQAIVDYVSLLGQAAMYAIVDLHWSAPGATPATRTAPMPDADHSVDFWTSVATTFRGNDAVILEVFNEPYPDLGHDTAEGWTCWRDGGTCPGVDFTVAGMKTLVTAIRSTGATNVIALGGLSWSNALTQWLAFRPDDPLNNMAAAWHVYNFNACSDVSCYSGGAALTAAQIPVVATEIGTNDCGAAFLGDLLGWLDGTQSGYLAWTWNAWGSTCAGMALIDDYGGTATTYGQMYRAHLATR
jgi:hypothetical protein